MKPWTFFLYLSVSNALQAKVLRDTFLCFKHYYKVKWVPVSYRVRAGDEFPYQHLDMLAAAALLSVDSRHVGFAGRASWPCTIHALVTCIADLWKAKMTQYAVHSVGWWWWWRCNDGRGQEWRWNWGGGGGATRGGRVPRCVGHFPAAALLQWFLRVCDGCSAVLFVVLCVSCGAARPQRFVPRGTPQVSSCVPCYKPIFLETLCHDVSGFQRLRLGTLLHVHASEISIIQTIKLGSG